VRAARFAVLSSLLVLGSCGYVGPVMPPSPEIPTQVNDLVAVERGDKIEVSFRTPPRTTDTLSIKKFSQIELRIGPAPEPFDFNIWAESAKPYPIAPPLPGDPLDPKPLPMAASIPLEGLVGRRVAIAVRTAVKAGDHFSAWSNRVAFEVTPPLADPSGVKVAASAEGIVLDWNAVEAATGYRILRQDPNGKNASEIGKSDQPPFVDGSAVFDTQYSYLVVALNNSAESLPSKPEAILYKDTFPPSVPGGVTALAGPDSVEVSWQRSPETDLAGYLVYRSVNGSDFERQGDMVNLPAFSDRKVEHGKTYRYQITSVDKKNNESAKSIATEVSF
jgi:hypothetical protein